MENRKTAKILILILTMALILGTAVCVIASASTEGPEIISQNIQYDEKFSLMYAVDASTVTAAPVTLELYYEDPASGAEAKRTYTSEAPQTEKIDGSDMSVYVFITEGVAAKYLGKTFYVKAIDATGAESEVVRYSVLEYMLERLYGGQTITEGQQKLYETVIDFAAYSQRVLINEADSDTANDIALANTYSRVTVSGGVILEAEDAADGYSHGVYPAGTKIYPYAEGATLPWTVTVYNSDGTSSSSVVENGGEVTVSGVNTVITSTPPVAGSYYATYGGLSYDNIAEIKELEISGNINRATYNVKDPATIDNWDGTSNYILLYDNNGNKVMKYHTAEADKTNGDIYIFDTEGSEGNCYVFETKIKLEMDATTATANASLTVPHVVYIQIAAATSNSGSATGTDSGVASSGVARIYARVGDDGELHYYINHTNYATDANILNADAEITEGWHTFTVEMYSNGRVKCYVDGKFVGDSKCISNNDLNGTNENYDFKFSEDANSLRISFSESDTTGDIDNSSIYFDDTFFGKLDKDYVAE